MNKMDDQLSQLGKWLRNKYLEWQLSEGDRRTVVEFAEYLGVPQPSLSEWMGGKYAPRGRSVAKLGGKLGFEIYDILDVPRPAPIELNRHLDKMLRAAAQLPIEVQARVSKALQRVVPIIIGQNVTNDEKVMWLLADILRDYLDPTIDPEKLAAELLGTSRTVYPVGYIFDFERTPENKARFRQTGVEAAKKIDELGLDPDSDEGQQVILQIFLDAKFPLLDTTGMEFNAPDDPFIKE